MTWVVDSRSDAHLVTMSGRAVCRSSDHPAGLDSRTLEEQCEIRRTRRSGPGGQNRNKVETAIVLVHRPSGLVAEASERRTQGENRRIALSRLRINLALEIRRPVEPQDGPSALWQSRCRGGRLAISPDHGDFPTLLAEALDVIAAQGLDVKKAAAVLGCTPSQLIKLLKDEPRALSQLNQRRELRGLHALR